VSGGFGVVIVDFEACRMLVIAAQAAAALPSDRFHAAF
jgi:hypothetical protein